MIKLICVGKLKETYWQDAVKEYQKRLTKYCKLELIEVSDFATDHVEVTQKKELQEIKKYINEKDYVVTMEIEGKEYDSVSLSETLEKIMMTNSNLVLLIGGSCGLHPELKERSNLSLSFSKLTFPHQLFRVMLLEQLYRSYKISHNESYHK